MEPLGKTLCIKDFTGQSRATIHSNGTIYLNRQWNILGPHAYSDVSGSRAMLLQVNIRRGNLDLQYRRSVQRIRESFVIYLPPFCILRSSGFLNRVTTISGILTEDGDMTGWSKEPAIFNVKWGTGITSLREARDFLNQGISGMAFPEQARENNIAHRVKAAIDNSYRDLNTLCEISEREQISQTQLSRHFKEEYGLTPKKYLNTLRSTQAMYKLLLREPHERIIDIALGVGFNDISRFNKQFKKIIRSKPRDIRESS